MPDPSNEPRPPPQLPGHWLKGNLQERIDDPLGMMVRLAQLGDVAQFRAYWIHVFQMCHPDAVKHVLVDRAANYTKGFTAEVLGPLLGMGLFTAEGEVWRRNRRLAQPAFHRERIAGWIRMMSDTTTPVVERWAGHARKGETFDAAQDMMSLTMSIVARALFSADVTGDAAEVGDALSLALRETNRRMLSFNPLDKWLPSQRNRDYARSIATMDAVIHRIIGERRAGGGPQDDLLGMLMSAKDADTGESLGDRELRDEAMTLFLAGHETTANALSWLWYLLATHPEAQQRVRDEVREVIGDRAPEAADLPKLRYLSRVIDETLRLYPPVWVFGRESIEADVIAGYRVPAKSIVSLPVWTIHRSPRFWEEPDRFDPDRFLPERSQGRPRHAYLPFGAGQRMCLGNIFALNEAQVIAARMIQRFRILIPDGHVAVPEPLVTLRPRGGMPLRLEELGPDGAALARA